MISKYKNYIIYCFALLVVIFLFALVDYYIHSLNVAWSVPEYYFRNKIIFGYLWGLLGLIFASNVENIWLKALTVSGTIAMTLQIRYFLEGYALSFILIFLFIHFFILLFLFLGMFKILK